jgi:hypothetical protein
MPEVSENVRLFSGPGILRCHTQRQGRTKWRTPSTDLFGCRMTIMLVHWFSGVGQQEALKGRRFDSWFDPFQSGVQLILLGQTCGECKTPRLPREARIEGRGEPADGRIALGQGLENGVDSVGTMDLEESGPLRANLCQISGGTGVVS